MEIHRHEWSSGLECALIHSQIPAGKYVGILSSTPRVVLLQDAELDLVSEGGAEETKVQVRTGDILVLPGEVPYRYHSLTPGADCEFRAFRIRLFASAAGAAGLITQFSGMIRRIVHIRGPFPPRVQFLLNQYAEEAECAQLGQAEMLEAIGTSIFVEVVRLVQPAENAVHHPNRAIVQSVQRYVGENLRKTFSLDDVAWSFRLSGEHVARTFKKETGLTVFQYLKRTRLETACRLLVDGSRKVHEVASAVGFSSHALFSREFRKVYGASPERYREQRRDHFSMEDLPPPLP